MSVCPVKGETQQEEEDRDEHEDRVHQDTGGLSVPHTQQAQQAGGRHYDERGEAAGDGDVHDSQPRRQVFRSLKYCRVRDTSVSNPGSGEEERVLILVGGHIKTSSPEAGVSVSQEEIVLVPRLPH